MTRTTTSRRAPLAAILAGAAVALALPAPAAAASDLTRYRGHVLESSIADVVAASASRPSDVTTVHERPSTIQVLEWRTPYTSIDSPEVDPVKGITFAFVDGLLYQLTIDYDRTRIVGLTTGDLVAGVAAVYGPQTQRPTRAVALTGAVADAVILGYWNDARASVMLVRGPYDDVQLLIRSTDLEARAATVIRAALKRDAAEAPARRQEAREADAAAALAERARNKSGFKP